MSDSSDHITEGYSPAHSGRVVIEDYRGPAADWPPSVPQRRHIAALDEPKREPDAALQFDPLTSTIDWPVALAKLGVLCGGGLIGGLLIQFLNFLTAIELIGSHPYIHFIPRDYTMLLVGIAIVGLALCTSALLRYRAARNPGATLFGSRLGLALNGVALLVTILGYIFGW